MTQICTLHFTRHYIDILQDMLLSLMLFCGKCIKVYVCRKLLKYSLVWQTYGKNKTVQFFLPHSVVLLGLLTFLTVPIWYSCPAPKYSTDTINKTTIWSILQTLASHQYKQFVDVPHLQANIMQLQSFLIIWQQKIPNLSCRLNVECRSTGMWAITHVKSDKPLTPDPLGKQLVRAINCLVQI